MSEPVLTGRAAHETSTGETANWLLHPERSGKVAAKYGWLRGPWLNVLLFLLTLLSTTVFGFAFAWSFHQGHGLNDENLLKGYELLLSGSEKIWTGLAYSLPLLLILLFHEFGHYFTCRRWKVKATLPYFVPSPTLLGTLGAFISIRSPIYRRRTLFDIGISGPVAGFVVLIPLLFIGVWNSRLCPSAGAHSVFSFGAPLLLRILEAWRFPGVSPHNICLHPMAMAAWAGLLATAINLLPVGQLDGGHILYATLGARGYEIVSRITVGLLGVAGFFYWPWWIWAVGMFFFRRRHPLIHDAESLGKRRRLLAVAAVLLFLLSFSIVPVRVGS
ncbi:MAG: site-2 protease family protein [Acidobacteriaceae bacterium]|nr:site-2 protease family protein [Acidobacteriaceae bacterium]